jgi:hypothetical protein
MFLRQLSLLAIKRIEGINETLMGIKQIFLKCKKYINDDMMHSRNSILKIWDVTTRRATTRGVTTGRRKRKYMSPSESGE